MKRRNVFIVLLVLVVAAVIWALRDRKPTIIAKPESSPVPMIAASAPPWNGMAAPSPASSPILVQEPGGPYEPRDPRWAKWKEETKRDPTFEWKQPIDFFGKVVEEKGQPVQGALIKMIGTDLSATGNFIETRVSDASGLFALTGGTGKFLSVEVGKDGYYTAQTENRTGFEYAAFFDPSYYQPDPEKPVIFHLRRKGTPAPLAALDGKSVMTFGTPWAIPMPPELGAASPINVTVFENDLKTGTWKARISVDGGGVQPAMEEFPFEAPADRYQASIDLDQTSPHPPGWQELGQGGWFYFKMSQGYGLLKLEQMKGKRTLHYTVLVNTQGGTDLEPAK